MLLTPTGIVPLDRLRREDRAAAGGKAYQCARLRHAGFAVPDGLVVLAHATDEDIARLPDEYWFDEQPAGAVYAVRSSAADEDGEEQSFAGLHETRLNVARTDVVPAVHACRASVGSSQACAYRRARGMSADRVESGVLVQRMIHPVVAGVAFTINPITGATGELVINASWGIGDALVSGQIDPDEFYLRKQDLEVVSSRIGEKGDGSLQASLTPTQLYELGRLLNAIERHYGGPQDVEWCYDGRQFWIVQSRPVTAITPRANDTEWTRANLVEVLPEITSPQALDAFEDLLNRAERQFMGGLMASESGSGPMVRSFNGRLYFNLTQLRRVSAIGGVPAADVLRSVGHQGAIEPGDERPAPAPLAERLRCLPDLFRIAWRHLRASARFRQHEQTTSALMARWSAIDPTTASDECLLTEVEAWRRASADHMQIVLTLGGVLFHEAPMRRICESVGMAFEPLLYAHLAAGEPSVSAQQAFDLITLADLARSEPGTMDAVLRDPLDIMTLRRAASGTAFLAALDRFLNLYGHRGVYESDWALPRYSEDPTPILVTVREHLRGPARRTTAAIAAEQTARAADTWREFEERLTFWQRVTVRPRVRRGLRRVKQYYLWRERCRFNMMRVIAVLRRWHLVFAARFVERGWLDSIDQYFLLTLCEAAAAIRNPATAGTLRGIAAARASELNRVRPIAMPLLMRESDLPRLIRMAGLTGGDSTGELTGHGVSGGSVEGEVVVIRDPGDVGRMKRGAILVTRATDPSWTPLFTLAAGVIVEVGGVLSHASTIARELGLPALANVRNATMLLRTGARVRLDADAGVVQRLPSPQSAAVAASAHSRLRRSPS
jgi:phosphohistidine swiveling domain-containing protein